MKRFVAIILCCLFFVVVVPADEAYQHINTTIPENLTVPYETETFTDINGTTYEYVKDEVIIQFKQEIIDQPDLYQNLSQQTLAGTNSTIAFDYGDYGLTGLMLVKISGNMTVDSAIASFMNTTYIEYAQPNYIKKVDPTLPSGMNEQEKKSPSSRATDSLPNDPDYYLQWALPKISAPNAWDISTGSPDTVVAVIDPDGVDIGHPDLKNNIWDISSTSYLGDHGTHCTGIIAGEGNNGIGISGVMWHAKVLPYQFSNSNSEIIAFSNAKYHDASIISCSFGGGYDPAEKAAIARSNALVICSAGNNGVNTDNSPQYPSCYDLDNIISVGATDQQDNLASFSNYGISSVHVAAPGVDILSSISNSRYDYKSGTSMAVPMVAGVAGLIRSKYPGVSNAQIKSAILNTVDPVPSLVGKVTTGGRLNAYDALKSLEPPPTNGSIFIESNPSAAKIYCDDMDTGNVTPATLPGLTPGSHVVRCRLDGYGDSSREVTVIAGETTSVQMILNKTKVNPPDSIKDLGPVSLQQNSITWTWADPSSADFDTVMIYLDGVFRDNMTKGIRTYRASALQPDTSYTIATHTVSRTGLINETWVNNTARTASEVQVNIIKIYPGWNFISTPKKLSAMSNTVDVVFSNLDFDHHSPLLYNGQNKTWIQYTNGIMTPLDGIWVYSKFPVDIPLQFDTTGIPLPPSKPVYTGWNAIGETGVDAISARELLTQVGQLDGNWDTLIGINTSSHLSETYIRGSSNPAFSDSKLTYPTKGYWLQMNTNDTLEGLL